ncbi:plastocyanin/azurin family copper-binding protein [Streptomyces sp. NRRL S-646]|uniref:plastocyanin/azurin family copper-binding protein n=1 Tax=Streptomyces sp. NRRL S-646 TaxID=1463917 RepID=UPI00068DF547|nr:plastocyanin/azurin family copper-binding protein [Streptomyces sp. NRRL S-646]
MELTARKSRTTGAALGVTASVFAAALVLAACSSGGGGGGGGSASSGASKASGTRVTVTETEYGLKLSRSSFTPGTYTFVADNAGKVTHALSIDGPGVEDAKTKNIQSGQQAMVTVTFKKGTYDLYCPVDSHKQLGMNKHIQVG